jgi:hypothetical protein
MLSLDSSNFPSKDGLVRATWAPVLLRPIIGSPEQLVIGVAAVGDGDFCIERANGFDRLQCLFAGDANMTIVAAQAALDFLSEQLAVQPMCALTDFSGVVIGEVREGEGESLRQIAVTWMTALSSLYRPAAATQFDLPAVTAVNVADVVEIEQVGDRLPALVLNYVIQKRPGLDRYFRKDIRDKIRQRRTNISGVNIDFAGSKLVANFGTLFASQYAPSVDRIKTRLWELKVDRDTARGALIYRAHEMIVQHPGSDNPQVTEKQAARVTEALEALEEQAKKEEICLRPLQSVTQIGEHILRQEAA